MSVRIRRLALALALVASVVRVHGAAPESGGDPGWPTLDAVLQNRSGRERPILVNFYKQSCPYCSKLRLAFEDRKHATQLEKIRKAQVDVLSTRGGGLASRLSVTAVPTLVLLDSSGRVTDRLDGLPDPSALERLLDRAERSRGSAPPHAEGWITAGDLAMDAGAWRRGADCYAHAMQSAGVLPAMADGARLRYSAALEAGGRGKDAADALEPFVEATEPGPVARAALDRLVRLRRSLADRAGEERAMRAFGRLFPSIPAP